MDLIGILGTAFETFGSSALDVIAGGLAWLVGLLADLMLVLSAALPDDPFQLPQVAGQWETGLGWLNWWLPIGQIGVCLTAWVGATVAYYIFQFKLRTVIKGK